MIYDKEQYTTEELAEKWGIKSQTLRRWRMVDRGPAWIKRGDNVYYTADALCAYDKQNTNAGDAINLPTSTEFINETEYQFCMIMSELVVRVADGNEDIIGETVSDIYLRFPRIQEVMKHASELTKHRETIEYINQMINACDQGTA